MANSSFRTIPKHQEELLKGSKQTNFSLYFPRMVSWEFKHGNGEFQKYTGEEIKLDRNGNPKWEKQNDDYMEELCKAGNDLLKGATLFLANIHKFQSKYIEVLKVSGVETFEIKAKTTSPFITGLGSGHPTETGMILDRNTGLPYIPASSIKGVLRLACAINIANEKYSDGNVPDDDEKLVKYFGSESDKNPKRGQLIILDAYSEQVPKLKVDIMNPHFGMYYSGENKQPVETESPVPIKFLTVKEGTTFVFRCVFMPLLNTTLSDEEIQTDVNEMFKTAFETVGFGGKTAIGYGRFKKIKKETPTK